jgi:hypothetical protein
MPHPIATTETSVQIAGDRLRYPVDADEGGRLAGLYWRSARRAALGLVAVQGDPLGPVRLSLVSRRGPALLSFGPAEVAAGDGSVAVVFPILGGLAAAARGGDLVLGIERNGHDARISVRVDGYTPRFAHPRAATQVAARAYAAAQRVVHRRVTTRFLAELTRDEG